MSAIRLYGGALLLGMLGMGLFQGGGCLYHDLRFLHQARLDYEKAQQQRSAPRPQSKPPEAPAP